MATFLDHPSRIPKYRRNCAPSLYLNHSVAMSCRGMSGANKLRLPAIRRNTQAQLTLCATRAVTLLTLVLLFSVMALWHWSQPTVDCGTSVAASRSHKMFGALCNLHPQRSGANSFQKCIYEGKKVIERQDAHNQIFTQL